MLGTLYSKRKALETAERRGRVRALVMPPIYVNLGNSNGGLVFNISEDGLALTAALDLARGDFITMRILLPDSEGWIEASGEIAWRGDSKKEGGVRFVGLAEEARRRISSWIAAETSRGEFQEKNDAKAEFTGVAQDTHQRIKNWTTSETPGEQFEKEASTRPETRKQDVRQRLKDWIFQEASGRDYGQEKDEPSEKEKRIVDIASVHASSSPIHESEIRRPIVGKEKQGAIVPANSDTHLGGAASDVGKLDLRHAPVIPGKTRDARGAPEVAERRAQARTLITPPVYVDLENTNGGLAFNMSENGIALTAALALAGNHTMSLRIQIPDSRGWAEVSGRLAWRGGGSGKTAGIKFIDMPEDSQQRIRDWLAAEASGSKLREEERMLVKSEQHPSDDVPAETTMVPLPAILNANRVVEKRMLEALLSGDRSASINTPGKVSISRQEPQRELPEDSFKLPSSPAEQVEILGNSKHKVSDSGEVPSLGAVQEEPRASALSDLAASGMRGDKLPDTVDTLDAVHLQLPERRKIRPKSRRAFHRTISGTQTGKLRRLAAVVTLAGATAAGIGWIAAQPAVRNEVTTFVAQNKQSTNKPAEFEITRRPNEKANDQVVRSENIRSQSHELEPAAHGQATDSVTRTAPPHPQARDIGRPAAKSTANGAAHRTESSLLKSQPAKAFERTLVAAPIPAVESTRNQVAESSPAPPTESSPVPAKNPSASAASGATLSEVKEKESPPPVPEQPPAAVAPVWSVAVSADPYPSIRMPQDKSSKKASSTRSLQIGRVISRVEPIYPEEAKQQGTAGAVRLHVVVGRDGSVESVTPISGQASLAKAAVSAVREWRYAQTLLGGQPVETEQDILVKFHVAGPSMSKN
jgi:TonB family protein